MRPFSRLRLLASVLAATAVLSGLPVTPVPAGAREASEKELSEVQKKLEETRKLIKQTEAKQRAVRQDVAGQRAQREELAEDIAELRSDLDETRARLAVAEGELGVVERQLEEKTTQLQERLLALQAAHDQLQQRAVQVYKSGPVSMFEVLFGADTLGALIARVRVLGRVFYADEQRLNTIREDRDRLTAEKQEIESLRARAAAQVAVVARERNRVAGISSSLSARQAALDKSISRGTATIAELEKDKAAYLKQQAELEAASRRIASLLKGRTGGSASVGPGGMIWPTSGPVTSGYGYRTHPIYGTRRFHAGIDIGAPTGQAILAAASGTVISAGRNGGYGNAVVVDHGGGLATVYAHLSSFSVSQGAKVAQGSKLGGVGCTGSCTGPHLHFEVREDGEPRNPMRWLG